MDKQLLKALDNLSVGLEQLVEALNNKGESKTDTGSALQSGDFGKSLEQISVDIQSIKTDTQEILKNQQTIISLFKQKKDEKKTEEMEGGDPKKESKIKKGLASILLIAVAVLAIGMAFKLVGKVNILSVLALGIGIVLVAYAFERVSKIKGPTGGPMTIKEAAIVSAIMVIASLAVTVSSWVLSKIKPLTVPQILTAASIALLFTIVTPAICKLIKSMTTEEQIEFRGMKIKSSSMSFGTVLKAAVMLPLLMVAMSIGITLSSMILSRITPISIPKALTAILIGVMFAIVAKGIAGLITSLTTSQEASGGGFGFKTSSIGMAKMAAVILGLPLIMYMIAKGITWSSHVLNEIKPIGFRQAITAILIAAMFAVVSMGMAKLINSLEGTDPVAILLLPIVLVAISFAIAYSAQIFSDYKSSFNSLGYGTIFKILLVGATISIIAFIMSFAVNKLKNLNLDTVLLIPIFFVTMSMGLALSAFILAKPVFKKSFDSLNYSTIFKILLVGFAMGVTTVLVAFASKFLQKIDLKTVILLPLLFTLMSLALSVSAFIFSKFKSSFDKLSFTMIFKILVFGVVLAIVMVVFAVATKIIGKLVKPVDALKGGLVIIILAAVIAVASLVLSIGSYKKFPSLKWALGVGLSLAAFGIAALLLGSAVFGPQAFVFLAGLAAILVVTATIMVASHILNAGNYSKFPSLKWAVAVSLLLGTFGAGAIILGAFAMTPIFYLGVGAILVVAFSIVLTEKILNIGKYDKYPPLKWILSTVFLMSSFGLGALILGTFALLPMFWLGIGAILAVAAVIVGTAKILNIGKYDKYPPLKWIVSTIFLLSSFGLGAVILGTFALLPMFWLGIGAILAVAAVIVGAAQILNKGRYDKFPTAKWTLSVGLALAGFAVGAILLGFNVLNPFFWVGLPMILTVAETIVDVAKILSKGKYDAQFGQWAKGVVLLYATFVPLILILGAVGVAAAISGFFGGPNPFEKGRTMLKSIANSIVDVSKILNKGKFTSNFPSLKWILGVRKTLSDFSIISKQVSRVGVTISDILKVNMIAMSIGSVANILYKNRKGFSFQIKSSWVKSLSQNIIGFAKLALQLDKLLVSEKTVASGSINFLGIKGSASLKTKERKDLSLVKDIAIQMSTVAGILYSNRKFFSSSVSNSVKNWGKSILGPSGAILSYAKTVLLLERMTGGGFKNLKMGLSAFGFGGYDIVTDYAYRLVRVANIIQKGRKGFETKVDPFFMRKVGQNLIDFTFVVKKIAEIEGKGSTFMGRLGSAFESAIGTDPISQTTRKMMTLAKGYDAMATALLKLGKALKLLKMKNLTELGSVTKGLTSGKFDPNQRVSPVKTKELFSVSDKKKKLTSGQEQKNEILYVSQKMDEVVKLLTQIRMNTNSIDGFVTAQGNKPKEPLEIKVDVKQRKPGK